MPAGHETTELLRRIALNTQKENSAKTAAQEEFLNLWLHLLFTLPRATPPYVQNEDGSFPYMPCYDGTTLG